MGKEVKSKAHFGKQQSAGKAAANSGWIFLAAGRKCGLKDVKVVGFSSTHTALKFVIPLSKR
jgi:hypothetical protein